MKTLPEAFLQELNSTLPLEEVQLLLEAMAETSNTCIRLNRAKNASTSLPQREVPWCSDAILLDQRPDFAADPLFHSGHYYVQEASSTIIGSLVQQLCGNEAQVVLDLCAAPGGKSTHVASVLGANSILIANEVIQTRTPILHENLCKWGKGNHIITRADAKHFGSSALAVDLIVADMPCSGEGLFRKDENAIDAWSSGNVALCNARQLRIAHDIWPALKEGGYMIYSTCTLNRAENEDNVQRICEELGATVLELDLPASWNLFSLVPGMYRMMPHRGPGEGFFFAVLQKTAAQHRSTRSAKPAWKTVQLPQMPKNLHVFHHVQQGAEHLHAWQGEDPAALFEILSQLPAIYAAGVPAGKILEKRSGTQFKPETALALLSGAELPWPVVEVSDKDIIAYLQRESLSNPQGLEGIHRVQWRSKTVGIANGTGRNWNNLWPMEWRLRSARNAETVLD